MEKPLFKHYQARKNHNLYNRQTHKISMSDPTKEAIKEAFAKAKQDIFNLSSQIESLKREIQSLKEIVKASQNHPADRPTDNSTHPTTENPAHKPDNQTIQHINTAEKDPSTDNPAHNQGLYALKTQFPDFSTGNRGVPADRQTDQQTDNKHLDIELNEPLSPKMPSKIQHINTQTTQQPTPKNLEKEQKPLEFVSNLLESLDSIKKDLRQKFKRLTQQEMAVFSAIYQLEEEGFVVDYPLISQKLGLTESSIRDYIQRLIKKGVPLIKNKENNKKILLSISSELKKIASLNTIIQLREL